MIKKLMALFGKSTVLDYKEGQQWAYQSRAGEEQSTVLINKIEKDEKLGKIFHISVDGLRVKNPHIEDGFSTKMPHFPVSEKTLKASLTQCLATKPINADYAEGYQVWKSAFDDGQAGVFTISVAEIVNFVEDSINQ